MVQRMSVGWVCAKHTVARIVLHITGSLQHVPYRVAGIVQATPGR